MSTESSRTAIPVSIVLVVGGGVALAASLFAILRYHFVEAGVLTAISIIYVIGGLSTSRLSVAPALFPRWILPAGVAFAAVEFTNIYLEQFVGLPSPANAIVPASAMGLMILTGSTVAVVASSDDPFLARIISAVTVVGIGMLLSCAATLLFVSIRVASNAEPASLLALTIANAAMHLTLPLLVTSLVALFAAAIAAWASSFARRAAMCISLAGIPVLSTGVVLLVRAQSLPRLERPNVVMPGMALSVIGLVLLPCVLARAPRERDLV